MNRRECLAGLLATALARGQQPARRPNLLLIFIDDLGYGDLGCYGGTLVPTPAIDALAASGVRCTDGYVTAPICGPSRAGLMSGAYQQRFGIEANEDQWPRAWPYQQWGEQRLLPEILHAAGYHTGQIGKWNLARDPATVFDETHAVMEWKGDYFAQPDGSYRGVDGVEIKDEHHRWSAADDPGEYLTDRLTRHACEFIAAQRSRPWFLYLAYNAVHSPWQAPREWQSRLGGVDDPVRLYAAMLGALDEGIGRVTQALRDAGVAQDTLVAFISDNGPAMGRRGMGDWRESWPDEIAMGSAGPLTGHKGQLSEGGIRVPFCLSWPGRLPAGRVHAQPVITTDILPTFCRAAGAVVPNGNHVDGRDIVPELAGERTPDPRILYWRQGDGLAAREGSLKLFKWPKPPEPVLYDLSDGYDESRNVRHRHPEAYARLTDAWGTWSAQLAEPATARFLAAQKR